MTEIRKHCNITVQIYGYTWRIFLCFKHDIQKNNAIQLYALFIKNDKRTCLRILYYR